jgi:hypothetical protein
MAAGCDEKERRKRKGNGEGRGLSGRRETKMEEVCLARRDKDEGG